MRVVLAFTFPLLALVSLKLFGLIKTSWVWVLLPAWAIVAVPVFVVVAISGCAICVFLVGLIFQAVVKMFQPRSERYEYDDEGSPYRLSSYSSLVYRVPIADAVHWGNRRGQCTHAIRLEIEALRKDRRTRLFGDETAV